MVLKVLVAQFCHTIILSIIPHYSSQYLIILIICKYLYYNHNHTPVIDLIDCSQINHRLLHSKYFYHSETVPHSEMFLYLLDCSPIRYAWSTVQVPLWCCVCIVNRYGTLLNWPIVSLLFLFIFFSMFCVLIYDYTLCFTGSPCCKFSYCKFSYYNYISIWPCYIVIHYTSWSVPQSEMFYTY